MIKYYENEDENDIAYMIQSGARGNWGQLAQLAAMKGLVANPSGKTIELPVQSNLKEGFSVLEYFIATHGGRKGKSDTALKPRIITFEFTPLAQCINRFSKG